MGKKIIFMLALCALPLVVFAESSVSHEVFKQALPGTVALTFDDGPNPTFTPQILAVLKKYNIKVTFFMVGMEAEKYPEIVKQVAADGHAISNHTLTHPMLTKLDDKELQREIALPSEIIYKITGKKPICLRYPFSAFDQRVQKVVYAHAMTPFPVGLNAYDYKRPGVNKIVDRVIKNVHSGMIITMHDGFANREQTVAALPLIIEGIKKKGLGFSQICINQ